MYNLIKIKESVSTGERSSRYNEKLYKIRDYEELTKIDWGEWIELENLGVKEISLWNLENLNKVYTKLNKESKKMKKELDKYIVENFPLLTND